VDTAPIDPEETENPDPTGAPLPWERGGLGGDKDSDQSFAAFDAYRLLGLQRSFVKVAAAVGKSAKMMEKWSSRDNWQVRVRAWDRWNSRAINERVLLGTAAMRERAAGIGLNLQVIAAKRLMEMSEEEKKKLSIGQLASMIRIGTAVEAAARGISPEEMDGALRDTAPTFNISFIADKPDNMVAVRIPTGETGYIPKEKVEAFLAVYPEGTVIA
jgi:hypothetical protein